MERDFDFDFRAQGVGIVYGSPWKDAAIKLLEPRSPYRPWRTHESPAPGQTVVVVLDTEPQSVLTGVGVIGADGDVDRALAKINTFMRSGLLELTTLNMVTELLLGQGEYGSASAAEVTLVLDRYIRTSAAMTAGHSTLAAGRVLLASRGRCTGCGVQTDLMGENARDRIHVHTVDARPSDQPDWPAVLCDDCHHRMSVGGFTTFLDFRFSLNPRCPECSAQRTAAASYGRPTGDSEEPWREPMGCCVREDSWRCTGCGHRW